MLICIEGLDASGKATQSKLLAERLTPSTLFSFPRYDTPIGQAIKRHLTGDIRLVEEVVIQQLGGYTNNDRPQVYYMPAPEDALMFQCLMLADKSDAASQMREILRRNEHVICDRWIPSSYCYGVADGLSKEWLERMHSSLPEADVNIFLDVPTEEATRRRPQARDRYERDKEKLARVRLLYTELWALNASKSYRWAVVDGLGSIEDVSTRILAVVRKRINASL